MSARKCRACRADAMEHTCDPLTVPPPATTVEFAEAEALCRAADDIYAAINPGVASRVKWEHMRPLDHAIWVAVAREARKIHRVPA